MSETNGNGQHTETIWQTDSFTSFMNAALGVGNAQYDSAAFDFIDTGISLLTDEEISAFTQKSKIAQRIIDIYPNDSAFGYPVISSTYGNYSVTSDQLVNYLNERLIDSRSLSLEQAFRKASRLARKWGIYYIVLGINDGRMPHEPIDENNIQSFEFLTLKNKRQLHPDDYYNPSYYYFDYDVRSNDLFKYLGEEVNKRTGTIRIHPDRVLVFRAVEKAEDFEGVYQPVSALQPCIEALLQRDKGGKFANQLLIKKAILWAKIQIQAAATPAAKIDNLQDRLGMINRHASIFRMIGMNRDEELGAVQIDLTGVDKVLEANDSELLVQTGIVRYKLFGQPATSGLSQASSGLEQKIDHASRCTSWSQENWKDHLERVYQLACLSQDSPSKGRSVKGLSVNLITYPELSPNDWALLREQNSKWALPMIAAGVLSEDEVRQSFYASGDLGAQMVPNPQLNNEYSERLKQKAIDTSNESEQIDHEDFDIEQVDCSCWFEDDELDEFDQEDESSYAMLVWLCDADNSNKHRTPQAVRITASSYSEARSKAITAAKKKCSRHCDKAYAVRLATTAEQKTAKTGWVRTGANHEKPGYKGLTGVGTKLKEHRDSGEIFTDKDLYRSVLAETKSKFLKYPSAYANGYLTKRYKERYKEKHGNLTKAFTSQQDAIEQNDSLKTWFKEDWVAINSSGEIVGECGSDKTQGKMKCLPRKKAESLSKDDRAKLARRKQRLDPDKDGTGKPINVSSQLDENIEAQPLDNDLLNKLLNKLGEVNENVIDRTLEDIL